MDTPGMIMYAELLLTPWRLKNGYRKIVVIWDNCTSHRDPCVLRAYEAMGIFIEELPGNMTDKLQVVDGVACGPLKAGQRAQRTSALYEYHQRVD